MNRKLSRRALLQNLMLATGGLALGPLTNSRVYAAGKSYKGKLLVTLQLNGGADVTSFCDPKTNTNGQPKINHWADDSGPEQAGRIAYAPVAKNARFFKKFRKHMLVVNGVDAQTNAHTTGVLYNWSGRNSVGAPSLTALHAAKNSPELPLAYATMGGYSQTAGLIRFTRINNLSNIRSLLAPNLNPWDGLPARTAVETQAVDGFTDSSLNRLASTSLSPRQLASIDAYNDARNSRGRLEDLLDILPADKDLAPDVALATPDGSNSDLMRRIQGALLIFKAGLGSAADVELGGFDSHDANDAWQQPLFSHVADAVEYFWDYAEELKLADRLMLVIGSDFGRTNFYNDADGKDHWPIGSYIVMENKPNWGDRVVGATDKLHFPIPINSKSLKRDRKNGVNLLPSHVHLALRKYLKLDTYANDVGFRLNVESLDLFNPKKRTV